MALMKQITAYVERDSQVPPSSTASVTPRQAGMVDLSQLTDRTAV
jgi:hypothetical protein